MVRYCDDICMGLTNKQILNSKINLDPLSLLMMGIVWNETLDEKSDLYFVDWLIILHDYSKYYYSIPFKVKESGGNKATGKFNKNLDNIQFWNQKCVTKIRSTVRLCFHITQELKLFKYIFESIEFAWQLHNANIECNEKEKY